MPLVLPGQEVRLNEPGRTFERHHHLGAYAALLVSGSCHESGDRGRYTAVAGDVLVHCAFDGHVDQIGARGATFINIRLSNPLPSPFGRVIDLDGLIRTIERDPSRAEETLRNQFIPASLRLNDWPDLLASILATDQSTRLDIWAEEKGLHPGSLSRGFTLAYGISPRRYRLEQMAAKAARQVLGSAASLATLATDCGFADQAHMTRSFVALFGVTPAKLRRLG